MGPSFPLQPSGARTQKSAHSKHVMLMQNTLLIKVVSVWFKNIEDDFQL